MKCVAVWPLGLLYLLSDFIYLVVYYVVGYRRKTVRQNLEAAFPEKSARELKQVEKDFYHYMCDIIVETLKLLHISDKEMQRRVEVVNPEVVNSSVAEGKSAVLLLGHYGNWEWVQQLSRHLSNDVTQTSIYHPLNSPLWDNVYRRIRSRWNVYLLPMARAVRTLLDKDNQPWICGFIADARPRHIDEEARVPFLNHSTSFIVGPEVIGRKVGADFFYLDVERVKRGHYRLSFKPLKDDDALEEEKYPVMRAFWREFEGSIRKNPAYWLWSHKRWKYDPKM